jgi:hypothetical protein
VPAGENVLLNVLYNFCLYNVFHFFVSFWPKNLSAHFDFFYRGEKVLESHETCSADPQKNNFLPYMKKKKLLVCDHLAYSNQPTYIEPAVPVPHVRCALHCIGGCGWLGLGLGH